MRTRHAFCVPPVWTSHIPRGQRVPGLPHLGLPKRKGLSPENQHGAGHTLARQVHTPAPETRYWRVPACRTLIFSPWGHVGKGTEVHL